MPLALLGVQLQALVRHVKDRALKLPLSVVSITSGMPLVVVQHILGPLRVILVPHEQPIAAGIVLDVIPDHFRAFLMH